MQETAVAWKKEVGGRGAGLFTCGRGVENKGKARQGRGGHPSIIHFINSHLDHDLHTTTTDPPPSLPILFEADETKVEAE